MGEDMKTKALLVDDDRFTHLFVREKIKENKWDVELYDAYTVLEAFEELRSGVYDVALIDQNMETMQGSDVIRSVENLKLKTKIYIFTGYEKQFIEYQLRDLKNLAGVIHKPNMEEEFNRIFDKIKK
jgi:two-component SAPR family response regulator